MKTTIIPPNSIRVAAALLFTMIIAAGFTACFNEDNPVDTFNPADSFKPADTFNPEKVVGKWYYEFNQPGTFGEGEEAFEYGKIAIYGNLNADGTGSWYALFFDPYGNLIDPGNLFFGSGFRYTTSADGGVHVELNGQSALTQLMPSWDMTYQNGQLNSIDTYTNTHISLSPITAEQDALVQMCLRELGIGYDGEERIVDLSQLTSDYVAQDGDVLSGTLKAEVMISVADGATITLKDCSIQKKSYQHPNIICQGSAEIIMSGFSILSGTPGYPAIYVPDGSTLTLSGFGKVSAYGGGSTYGNICGGAAIGGGIGDYQNCGNIVIKSGKVEANGRALCAGIGSSEGGSCGNITIDGGKVHATGGTNGAGIGGGLKGKCKKISLNGGLVEATGGENYPAVGGGTEEGCFCGSIKIYGGDISCYAGKNCKYALGYGWDETNKNYGITLYPYFERLFMKTQDPNAKEVGDLMNCELPNFEDVSLLTYLDFLSFTKYSLDGDIDEVKHDIHYIAAYKAACIIPHVMKQ